MTASQIDSHTLQPGSGNGLQSGFTLIELLFAIFIFSIVISTVYTAYRTTFHITQGAGAQLEQANSARIILERFTEDLQSIVLGEGRRLVGGNQSLSGGRGDSLVFVSSVHLRFGKNEPPRGRSLVHYTTEDDEDGEGLKLYRSQTRLLPGAEPAENGDSYLLGENLREVRFTYIDVEGNELEQWGEEGEPEQGDEALELPAIVHISLSYAEDGVDEKGMVYATAVALPAGPKKEGEK